MWGSSEDAGGKAWLLQPGQPQPCGAPGLCTVRGSGLRDRTVQGDSPGCQSSPLGVTTPSPPSPGTLVTSPTTNPSEAAMSGTPSELSPRRVTLPYRVGFPGGQQPSAPAPSEPPHPRDTQPCPCPLPAQSDPNHPQGTQTPPSPPNPHRASK